MTFHTLRSFVAGVAALAATVLLSSCGGSGAGTDLQGGSMTIAPKTGTFYAGQVSTITITGGRKPYTLTSSEPSILAVPAQTESNSIQVVGNNPGVIDAGLQPSDLPRRTVIITVRDANGFTDSASIAVAQNFLTGYGLSLTPSNCPQPTTGSPVTACAGGTTAVRMSATFSGSLNGNRPFRFEVVRGNFSLRDPVTGQVSNAITVTSDHTGAVFGLIEVPAGVRTQLAVIRLVDVATGVYADTVFVISATAASQGLVTAIPSAVTFTGVDNKTCGTGSVDILLFDGVPPYSGTSTDPNLFVLNSPSSTQPGKITIQATNRNVCLSSQVVFTDSAGGRVTVQVTTALGSATPPAPPTFAVGPSTIALGCGATGSVTAVGGSGSYSANSGSANVTAVVSGNTVSITRAAVGPVTGGSTIVSVTDGSTIANVTVTSPATCP